MRRVSAFLMIAALVAVLVPSAALAGKSVPNIAEVRVTGSSGEGSGTPPCGLNFWARFTGTVQTVRSTPMVGETPVGQPSTWPVPRKADALGWYQSPVADLGTVAYSWKVELLDRKGKPLDEVTTTAEWWTSGTACPLAGVLAGYPQNTVPTPTFQSVCGTMGGEYWSDFVWKDDGIVPEGCYWDGPEYSATLIAYMDAVQPYCSGVPSQHDYAEPQGDAMLLCL